LKSFAGWVASNKKPLPKERFEAKLARDIRRIVTPLIMAPDISGARRVDGVTGIPAMVRAKAADRRKGARATISHITSLDAGSRAIEEMQ
jgi:hypothetical protein